MATIQNSKLDLLLTPRVPPGLAAAVEGLTREVIRHRPENIYVFAAHHFEKLLRLREEYGEDTATNKCNMKIITDMNDAIRKRSIYMETRKAKNFIRNSNWNLNETAKVLEKHRSIFGETSQKISIDEIRELANEKVITPPKIHSCSYKRKYEAHKAECKNRTDKFATATAGPSRGRDSTPPHRHHSQDSSGHSKSDSKSAPKIIPQITLAKDIKTELRKNRISSRERKKVEEKKMQVSCEYSEYSEYSECIKGKAIEKRYKKSIEKTKRSFESRSEQKKSVRSEDVTKRRSDATREKSEASRTKKSSRPDRMDEVKNYVIQNIIRMSRLDELQSPSYVQKVQEVVDETSMIIKEKVEAIKTGLPKTAKAKKTKSENSSSNDEGLRVSGKSDSDKRSIDGNLFKSSSYQNVSKSKESSKVVQDNFENAESLGNNENSIDQSLSKNSDNSNDSNDSNISLPAVRTSSSRSTSRSLSARSFTDGLVLPPISPESNKSTKVAEELVLPVLSPPRSNSITPDSINCNVKVAKTNQTNNSEEFQDSLNVTPEIADNIQRPDSLETSEIVDKSESSGHISPAETLKDKLLEIEEVQKRIEDVLDDNVSVKDKNSEKKEEEKEKVDDEIKVTSKIQDKLLEIEESEKRIEKILDSQSNALNEHEVINSDIKSKLQELEDMERRIGNIFTDESDNEHLNKTNSEQANDCLSCENIKNVDEINIQKDLEHSTLDLHQDSNELQKDNEEFALSPHCYVLTEGSPYDIPDTVTTVIIPDRCMSPDSDTLQLEVEEDNEIFSTLMSSKEKDVAQADNNSSDRSNVNELQGEEKRSIDDAFGEIVDPVNSETSTVDVDFLRGIKMTNDVMGRKDLDQIQEERDKEAEEAQDIDSEDEKVLKVVTSSLEEILEKDRVKYVSKEEIQTIPVSNIIKEEACNDSLEPVKHVQHESINEAKEISVSDGFVEKTEANENSLDTEETTGGSIESTNNDIKDTSFTTDRSSLPFDPVGPIVPELNLDSLLDLSVSSLNVTDDEQKDENKSETKDLKKESFKEKLDEKEIESDRVNAFETVRENYSFESETKSSEFIESLHTEITEQLTKEDYEESYENFKLNELDLGKCSHRSDETFTVKSENIQNEFEDQIQIQEDTLSDISLGSDIKGINVKNIIDAAYDEVINDPNENNQTKEINPPTTENEDNLLVESSLKEFENDPLPIEQNNLSDIDQNNKVVDSLKDSNEIAQTKELNSDNLLVESNTAEKNDTSAIQEEEKIDGEPLSDNFQVPDATAEEEKEINNSKTDEKKYCRIDAPETGVSNEASSPTGSSTFMSAATKIQAGIRGFLTRRRLQSTQRRSSTLDSVPSIEGSLVSDISTPAIKSVTSSSSTSYLKPIVENTSLSFESKNRKKLRREDALQSKTLSLENAFANNQIQHSGEFHDCIPLPLFDTQAFSFKLSKVQAHSDTNDNLDLKKNVSDATCTEPVDCTNSSNVGQFFEKIFSNSPAVPKLEEIVNVVMLPGCNEAALENKYLNFITSVEDAANDLLNDPSTLPGSPRGVIIEEITSFDEEKTQALESISNKENDNTKSEEKVTIEYSSEEVRPQSAQEKSSNCTSNIFQVTDSQSSDVKPDENLVKLQISVKVGEDLNIESFEESKTSEGKSDKDETSSSLHKTDNEIPETKETSSSSLIDPSITISEDVNIDEILGLGDEDKSRAAPKSEMMDLLKSSSVSQESHLADDATRSPLTMMQIDEKSDKNKSSSSDEVNKLST